MESIDWFKNSGVPSKKYDMVFSMYEAYDGCYEQHNEVWEPYAYSLEDIASEEIGEDEIDNIFVTISAAIGDVVWEKLWDFMIRQKLEESGVSFEMLNMVKRDMSWACIEKILNIDAFYTAVLNIYKEGYFPCSWVGKYPLGKFVVM